MPPQDDIYSTSLEASDVLTELHYARTRRPKTASHYRPHSVVVAEQEEEARKSHSISRTRSFYKPAASAVTRPLSIMSFGSRKSPLETLTAPASIPKPDDRLTATSRFTSSLRAKRKSLAIFETSRSTSPTPSKGYFDRKPHPPPPEPQIGQVEKSFTERLFWAQKNGQMLLHPYSSQGIPYMVAYDSILMQSDHYTSSLLQRLNPNGSPSFHDYGKKPPSTILDLGCGDMFWATEQAAVAWKKSQITAFDLVNAPAMLRVDEDRGIPENVRFVQGDFINHPLPFPNESFELVRMANLALAIPYNQWSSVLKEVHRVLKVGGRVEIIEDQLFFSYGPAPLSERPTWKHLSSFSSTSTFETYDSETGGLSHPQTKSHIQVPLSDKPLPPTPDDVSNRLEKWQATASLSKDLETIFGRMLTDKYGVHPRPHEFLVSVMGAIFGKQNATKLRTFHLKLAPASESKEADRASLESADSGYASGGNPKLEKAPKGVARPDESVVSLDSGSAPSLLSVLPMTMHRRTLSSGSSLTDISFKAADRLGIDLATLSQVLEPRRRRISLDSSQSPGIIVLPSTFIPVPPAELEMHTCKHMHTLLGSKSALVDYLAQQTDSDGNGVCHQDVEDSLWEYECFRRARFNWPRGLPDDVDSKQTSTPKAHSRPTSAGKTIGNAEELTHIRTFRIFEATKMQN